MSNAKVMLDFIKEQCPEKINKDWVIWAFHYVIQADIDNYKISKEFLEMSKLGGGKIQNLDPILGHFNCKSEDMEPEMT